jgi:hypothetical protein
MVDEVLLIAVTLYLEVQLIKRAAKLKSRINLNVFFIVNILYLNLLN